MKMDKQELEAIINKIAQYRGAIIHDSINIEALIEAIIAVYFVRDNKNNEFNRKVLDDEYFSFGLKIRILEKINIGLEKKLTEKIRKINDIRNKFAHKVPGIIPKSGPISISFDITKEAPEKIEDLHKEFLKLLEEVKPELDKIFWKLVEENKKNGERV